MLKKQFVAVVCAVLIGLTWAGSIIAAEQRPGEMIVAMASSKSICGGNTGRACPGTAPATVPPVTPPVSAAPTPTSSSAQVATGSTIGTFAPDPVGGTLGFARAHWITSINKMVILLTGNGPFSDNSVRAYDPVKNSWEYLWPNSNGANGP